MKSQLERKPRPSATTMPEINEFAEVVREHHASLRYFIRSLGVQQAWVDDVAQDAFVIAYRKWSELDHTANVGAWLRVIARNVVMNEISKSSRRQRILDENITAILLENQSESSAPESLGDYGIRQEALRDCLSRLPERTRGVVDARYFRDLNSSQIGEDLNMKATAVRKILFQARQLLADCLQGKSIYDARG